MKQYIYKMLQTYSQLKEQRKKQLQKQQNPYDYELINEVDKEYEKMKEQKKVVNKQKKNGVMFLKKKHNPIKLVRINKKLTRQDRPKGINIDLQEMQNNKDNNNFRLPSYYQPNQPQYSESKYDSYSDKSDRFSEKKTKQFGVDDIDTSTQYGRKNFDPSSQLKEAAGQVIEQKQQRLQLRYNPDMTFDKIQTIKKDIYDQIIKTRGKIYGQQNQQEQEQIFKDFQAGIKLELKKVCENDIGKQQQLSEIIKMQDDDENAKDYMEMLANFQSEIQKTYSYQKKYEQKKKKTHANLLTKYESHRFYYDEAGRDDQQLQNDRQKYKQSIEQIFNKWDEKIDLKNEQNKNKLLNLVQVECDKFFAKNPKQKKYAKQIIDEIKNSRQWKKSGIQKSIKDKVTKIIDRISPNEGLQIKFAEDDNNEEEKKKIINNFYEQKIRKQLQKIDNAKDLEQIKKEFSQITKDIYSIISEKYGEEDAERDKYVFDEQVKEILEKQQTDEEKKQEISQFVQGIIQAIKDNEIFQSDENDEENKEESKEELIDEGDLEGDDRKYNKKDDDDDEDDKDKGQSTTVQQNQQNIGEKLMEIEKPAVQQKENPKGRKYVQVKKQTKQNINVPGQQLIQQNQLIIQQQYQSPERTKQSDEKFPVSSPKQDEYIKKYMQQMDDFETEKRLMQSVYNKTLVEQQKEYDKQINKLSTELAEKQKLLEQNLLNEEIIKQKSKEIEQINKEKIQQQQAIQQVQEQKEQLQQEYERLIEIQKQNVNDKENQKKLLQQKDQQVAELQNQLQKHEQINLKMFEELEQSKKNLESFTKDYTRVIENIPDIREEQHQRDLEQYQESLRQYQLEKEQLQHDMQNQIKKSYNAEQYVQQQLTNLQYQQQVANELQQQNSTLQQQLQQLQEQLAQQQAEKQTTDQIKNALQQQQQIAEQLQKEKQQVEIFAKEKEGVIQQLQQQLMHQKLVFDQKQMNDVKADEECFCQMKQIFFEMQQQIDQKTQVANQANQQLEQLKQYTQELTNSFKQQIDKQQKQYLQLKAAEKELDFTRQQLEQQSQQSQDQQLQLQKYNQIQEVKKQILKNRQEQTYFKALEDDYQNQYNQIVSWDPNQWKTNQLPNLQFNNIPIQTEQSLFRNNFMIQQFKQMSMYKNGQIELLSQMRALLPQQQFQGQAKQIANTNQLAIGNQNTNQLAIGYQQQQ